MLFQAQFQALQTITDHDFHLGCQWLIDDPHKTLSLHQQRSKVLVFESPYCVEVDSAEELDLLDFQVQKYGSPILNYLRGVK